MTTAPWNKGIHAYDRGWQDGYDAGVREHLTGRLRSLAPVGILLALVVVARRHRVHPALRLLALQALALVTVAFLVLLPVELPAAAWVLVRHHRRLRALRTPALKEPF